MKKLFSSILFLLSASFSCPTLANPNIFGTTNNIEVYEETAGTNENNDESLTDRLKNLLNDPIFERSQVGLYVYDLTDNKCLFVHNEDQCMRPASNQKLVTAISALHILGTDYQYKTVLYRDDHEIKDGAIHHLYIKGGYDPLLCESDLVAFADSIKKQGISRIQSDIYLDLSFKDDKRLGWGWCWDDKEVPLTPLLCNNKNKFKERFSAVLRRCGIEWEGNFRSKKVPGSAVQLATCLHTIDQVLLPMMKDSDNSMAESMFYQIAAHNHSHPGTRKMAVAKIENLIRDLGLTPSHYQIADGSGLSLYNYLSPRLLGKLLQFAYNNNKIYTHLLPSLPIAGEDGTLEKRMLNTAAADNVQAKTGTVEGVSTLSGYCTAANGHRLCFSIMNQGIRKTKTGRDFQDDVCEVLCR